MTGLLKDVMHDRADSLDPPELDVAAMVRDGERRAARRRAALGGLAGLAAAAAAVVAVGAPSLWPSGTRTATTTSESPFAAAFDAHEPAYALGATVHVDGRTFDVGRDVVAMVQSDAGVVFTDREGAVWAADGDGAPLEVGRTHARHPSLETDGSLVAWTERDGESRCTPSSTSRPAAAWSAAACRPNRAWDASATSGTLRWSMPSTAARSTSGTPAAWSHGTRRPTGSGSSVRRAASPSTTSRRG